MPERHGGLDTNENKITLCASCHEAVEKIYDDGNFWARVQQRFGNSASDILSDGGSSRTAGAIATELISNEMVDLSEFLTYHEIKDQPMFSKDLIHDKLNIKH